MWDFKTSTNSHTWTPGSIGAGYIFAPGNFGGDYSIFDYSIRTWNVGPDHTDDIEREYRRHVPIHPMVFRFYIDPSGGIHDGGHGFHNLTGKDVRSVIDYLRRTDNRLHDGREDVKPERVSALDELRSVISNFEPKISHDLSWVKGQKGKGLLLTEGKLVTWTVNRKQKPDHISMYQYLTGERLPNDFAFSFMSGFPFDIDETGQITFLTDPPEEVAFDVSKIDYRLKVSKTANELMDPQGFTQTDTGIAVPTQQGVQPQQLYVPGTDVNKGYQTREPGATDYDWNADPLNLKQHQELLNEMDVGLENLNENEMKTAISNAIRVALLSPKTPLQNNAAIYQAFLNIPYNETDEKVYLDVYHKLREDYQKGPKMQTGEKIQEDSPSTTEANVIRCAQAAGQIDEAFRAVQQDLANNDGEGHIFRNWMKNNISGAGGKVASFAWLILNPNQSNLATLDSHMFNMLNQEYADLDPRKDRKKRDALMSKELGSYRYIMWERVLRERAMSLGFPPEATNALIQWYLWDAARTNDPQSHAALRAIDPDSYLDVDWKGDALSGSAFGIEQSFPNWQETQQAGDLARQQWDQAAQQVLNEGAEDKLFVKDKATGLPKKDPANLSWQDIEKIVQNRPDLLDYFLRPQSSIKKEFTKEDAFDLMDELGLDFDGNEFWMGMNDELEHDWLTHGDPETTAKIVADHLSEHPDYYSRLHNTFKTAALNEYVEMVPTEVLAKYAEYNEPISEEHLASLEEDIKTNGIQEPVVIDYDQDTGQAHISEGNHRILAAQNLGIESVPAFVYRSSRKGQRSMPADLVKEDSWADPFDPSGFRVPQYMKPSQIKIARPADPEWWGQQSQEDPYVYHVTSGKNLQFIAEQGLTPWDSNSSNTLYTEDHVPRPDHVYFSTTYPKARGYAEGVSDPFILRVNKNQLNPELINPDEDVSGKVFEKTPAKDWAVPQSIYDINSDRNSEIQEMVDEGVDNDDINRYEEENPISYGQIAEEVGYGDDPEDTRRGIELHNTLAYRGTISPELIEYTEYNQDDPWQPITNLLQQQLSPTAKASAWDKPIKEMTRAELEYIATR